MNPSKLHGYIELAKLGALAADLRERAERNRKLACGEDLSLKAVTLRGRAQAFDESAAETELLCRDTEPPPPPEPDEPIPDTQRDGRHPADLHDRGEV
jgi:hypothetical protein